MSTSAKSVVLSLAVVTSACGDGCGGAKVTARSNEPANPGPPNAPPPEDAGVVEPPKLTLTRLSPPRRSIIDAWDPAGRFAGGGANCDVWELAREGSERAIQDACPVYRGRAAPSLCDSWRLARGSSRDGKTRVVRDARGVTVVRGDARRALSCGAHGCDDLAVALQPDGLGFAAWWVRGKKLEWHDLASPQVASLDVAIDWYGVPLVPTRGDLAIGDDGRTYLFATQRGAETRRKIVAAGADRKLVDFPGADMGASHEGFDPFGRYFVQSSEGEGGPSPVGDIGFALRPLSEASSLHCHDELPVASETASRWSLDGTACVSEVTHHEVGTGFQGFAVELTRFSPARLTVNGFVRQDVSNDGGARVDFAISPSGSRIAVLQETHAIAEKASLSRKLFVLGEGGLIGPVELSGKATLSEDAFGADESSFYVQRDSYGETYSLSSFASPTRTAGSRAKKKKKEAASPARAFTCGPGNVMQRMADGRKLLASIAADGGATLSTDTLYFDGADGPEQVVFRRGDLDNGELVTNAAFEDRLRFPGLAKAFFEGTPLAVPPFLGAAYGPAPRLHLEAKLEGKIIRVRTEASGGASTVRTRVFLDGAPVDSYVARARELVTEAHGDDPTIGAVACNEDDGLCAPRESVIPRAR